MTHDEMRALATSNPIHSGEAVELLWYLLRYAYPDPLLYGTKRRAAQAERWLEREERRRAEEKSE